MSRLEQIVKMLETEPDDVFLNFGLAMEYVREGRPDDAVRQFDRVIELDPAYIPAHFQKGNTLIKMARPAEARAALELGIATARNIGDPHAAEEMNLLLQGL